MRQAFFLSLIALLFHGGLPCLTPEAAATVYYVDQTAGNDANTGLLGHPWKNSPGTAAYSGSVVLQPGDTVYFDRADTWTFSAPYNGSYDPSSFCFNRGAAFCPKGGVQYIGDTWQADGGTSSSRATFKMLVGEGTLFEMVMFANDHPTLPTVLKGFNLDGNGKILTGVGFNSPQLGSIGLGVQLLGAAKRVENCIIHDALNQYGIYGYNYGIRVYASEFDENGKHYNFRTENVEIIDNKIYNIGRDGIVLYPDHGTPIGSILVRGNEVYNTGLQADYDGGVGCRIGSNLVLKGSMTNVLVENNYLHDAAPCGKNLLMWDHETDQGGGYQLGIKVRNNILDCGASRGGSKFGCMRLGTAFANFTRELDFYGNIAYDSLSCSSGEPYGGLWYYTKGPSTLRIFNNTFAGACMFIQDRGTFTALDIRNNISYGTNSGIIKAPVVGTSANNLTSFPGFKNAADLPTGFVGTFGVDRRPNRDGLSILPGGAAQGAAANLGSAYSSSINSVLRGSSWDIGAYQIGGPVAQIAADKTSGLSPLTVTFSSAGSSDPENEPLTYSWSFGDGGTSSQQNPIHTYSLDGSYTATLIVSDGKTSSAPASIVIRAGNQPPVAQVAASPQSGLPPLAVTFSSAGSSDPEGVQLTYSWNFGDGTPLSTVANPTHTYQSLGRYEATLTVSDGVHQAVKSLPIVVSNGLVAAFGFDEGIGNSIKDLSSFENHGIQSNSTWVAGKFGEALAFNGANSLVTIPNSPSLNLTAGMTLEAWVYPTAIGGWRDVIYKSNDIYFLMGSTTSNSAIGLGGTFAGSALIGSILPLNVWSHLAGTYDGANLRLYLNGVQVASRAQTGLIGTSGDALTIGGDAVAGQFWSGKIDEVRIYNRALSASEIAKDRDTPISLGNPPPAPPTGLMIVQ